MLIFAIAWIYVVGMIAVTETSIVAGILDFVLYCILPMSLVLYLQRSKMRKARNEHLQRLRARQALDPALHEDKAQGATPDGNALPLMPVFLPESSALTDAVSMETKSDSSDALDAGNFSNSGDSSAGNDSSNDSSDSSDSGGDSSSQSD